MKTASFVVAGPFLALLTFALIGPARAQTSPTLVVNGPTQLNMGTAMTLDIDVQFPAGDYAGLQLKVTYQSGISFEGGGSPTSGEFANAVSVSGGRAWNQVAPLDLTGGASLRRFRITLNLATGVFRDGTPIPITVALTGSSAETTGGALAPIATTPIEHVVVANGTRGFAWNTSLGAVANTTTVGGGPVVSGETIARPGVIRRFVFGTRNTGTSRMDGPQHWTISGGSGYVFVRAFGHSWSTINPANPANASSAVVVTSTHTAWAPHNGLVTATYAGSLGTPPALFVDFFVPCDDYGQTAENSAAAASTYELTSYVESRFTNHAEEVTVVSLQRGPADAPDLTSACGEGGQVIKTSGALVLGGSASRWRIALSPPFGVPSIQDAMLVDVLPPGVVQLSSYGTGDNVLNHFTPWVCDFAAIFPGQFTPQQFLAERDTHCRQGYGAVLPTDTHLVFFAPTWGGGGGALLPVTADFQTGFDPTWARSSPGLRLENRAYFQGTTASFGALGDTVLEVGTEDPWESAALSLPLPEDINGLTLDISRDADGGNDASALIDANGQVRTFFARVSAGAVYPLNPWLAVDIPPGVEVLAINPSSTNNCVDFPPPEHRVFPTDLTANPFEFAFGDANYPWRLQSGCRAGGDVVFRLDPNYPFIDGEVITFTGLATSDIQVAADPTDWTVFRAVVTTGMDIKLEGGCWTDTVAGVTPPESGLILYQTTAINRGAEDLEDMELRFVVPAGSTYQTAFPGADFPIGATLEVSRDGGSTWANAPTLPDATITDVRVAGFAVAGLGVAALRPSFYVAVEANAPTGNVGGVAWVETPSFDLGRTTSTVVEVDAEACEPECICPPSTDECAITGCDAEGTCISMPIEDGTDCTLASDLCVLAASCQAGICRAISFVSCGDDDMCTLDTCNPLTGLCSSAATDCSARPIYMPVASQGQPAGAIRCDLVPSPGGHVLECDTVDGTFVLHAAQGGVCSGQGVPTPDPDPDPDPEPDPGGGGGGEVPF